MLQIVHTLLILIYDNIICTWNLNVKKWEGKPG